MNDDAFDQWVKDSLTQLDKSFSKIKQGLSEYQPEPTLDQLAEVQEACNPAGANKHTCCRGTPYCNVFHGFYDEAHTYTDTSGFTRYKANLGKVKREWPAQAVQAMQAQQYELDEDESAIEYKNTKQIVTSILLVAVLIGISILYLLGAITPDRAIASILLSCFINTGLQLWFEYH